MKIKSSNPRKIAYLKSVGSVPKLKFGGSGNLLDVLTQYTNFGYFRFIADLHNSAKVWVAHTEYTVSQKTIDGEMNTICDYRYVSSIPKKRNVFDFGYVYSICKYEDSRYLVFKGDICNLG